MLKVISAALFDNGKQGGQCKVWVQNVFARALEIEIPKNPQEVTHVWEDRPQDTRIKNLGASIRSAQPGDVVQMIIPVNRRPSSHTAIVGALTGETITWFESNYRRPETVSVDRTETIDEFLASLVANQYTVYRIR